MNQPLLLQCLEVAHDAVGALDLEMEADLADGRSVASPLNLAADEVVDFPLPRGECIQVGHGIAPSLANVVRRWMTAASMVTMYDTGDQ